MYVRRIKRCLDVLTSTTLLVMATPLLGLGALLIKVTSPGPVFFRQLRAGRGGYAFTILKLRTMTVDVDRPIKQTNATDPEVLLVGRTLRRLKIDELPQLWNVLRGDMSLIGPRPCLLETRDQMPQWAARRFAVRPGLTGLAQVNGNVSLSWEERWEYDVRYVAECTLALDAAILLKTILIVIVGEERFRRSM